MPDAKGRFIKGEPKTRNWEKAMSLRTGKNHKMWKGGRKVKIVKCECGCGEDMNLYGALNKPRRFIVGHNGNGRKWTEKQREKMSGPNNVKWISDRSKLATVNCDRSMHDPDMKIWRKKVYRRDDFKCRMDDGRCNGRIEAHHIRRWQLYPKLRYEVNNGITLCHSHHPRKINDEKRMIPEFERIMGTVRRK